MELAALFGKFYTKKSVTEEILNNIRASVFIAEIIVSETERQTLSNIIQHSNLHSWSKFTEEVGHYILASVNKKVHFLKIS